MNKLLPLLIFLTMAFTWSAFALENERVKKSASSSSQEYEWFHGVPTLKGNGNIVIEMALMGKDETIAHLHHVYVSTDPEYKDILDHVGKLNVGVPTKIKPWPEQESKKK